jgi:chromosome segregation ATPase
MEFDQIIKRLDWLDEEHRKDKSSLDALTDQLAETKGELKFANQKIKELSTELSQYSTIFARIDQFNGSLAQQRVEILKYIDDGQNKDVSKSRSKASTNPSSKCVKSKNQLSRSSAS